MAKSRRRIVLFAGVLFVYVFLRYSSSAPEPETWDSLSARGVRAMNDGRFDEAELAFEHAAEMVGDEPSWEHGTGLQNLGKLRLLQGRLDESDRLFRAAVEMLEAHPRDPAQVALLLNELAASRAKQGAMEEAVSYLQRAVLLDELADPASPQAIGRLRNFAAVLESVGRTDDATAATARAAALEEVHRTTTPPAAAPPS